MPLDIFINKDGKKLRCGYTTGSCAAAAAKAAAIVLEQKSAAGILSVQIDTPAGIALSLKAENMFFAEAENGISAYAEASIRKDSGDDPDSTDGISIFARVSKRSDGKVLITGGEGIGIIKKRGLFGEIGDAAINPVPRRMIKDEVLKISESGYNVMIFAPDGKKISKATFNKNIGIEDGISIIGTQGIVYPMSEDALKKTIYMEIDLIRENSGVENLLLVPGNHGEKIAENLGLKIPRVQTSNFIGDALSYAYSKSFRNFMLIGHIGKFAKLSIGIFNTHNRTADTRMESFVYYLALSGCPLSVLKKINTFLTAEECFNFLIDDGKADIIRMMEKGSERRIKTYLKDDEVKVKVITYSMSRGTVTEI